MTDPAAEQEAREIVNGCGPLHEWLSCSVRLDSNCRACRLIIRITTALQRRDDELARLHSLQEQTYRDLVATGTANNEQARQLSALKAQHEAAQREAERMTKLIRDHTCYSTETESALAEAQREIARLRDKAILPDEYEADMHALRENRREFKSRAEQAEAQVREVAMKVARLALKRQGVESEIAAMELVDRALTTPPSREE